MKGLGRLLSALALAIVIVVGAMQAQQKPLLDFCSSRCVLCGANWECYCDDYSQTTCYSYFQGWCCS